MEMETINAADHQISPTRENCGTAPPTASRARLPLIVLGLQGAIVIVLSIFLFTMVWTVYSAYHNNLEPMDDYYYDRYEVLRGWQGILVTIGAFSLSLLFQEIILRTPISFQNESGTIKMALASNSFLLLLTLVLTFCISFYQIYFAPAYNQDDNSKFFSLIVGLYFVLPFVTTSFYIVRMCVKVCKIK